MEKNWVTYNRVAIVQSRNLENVTTFFFLKKKRKWTEINRTTVRNSSYRIRGSRSIELILVVSEWTIGQIEGKIVQLRSTFRFLPISTYSTILLVLFPFAWCPSTMFVPYKILTTSKIPLHLCQVFPDHGELYEKRSFLAVGNVHRSITDAMTKRKKNDSNRLQRSNFFIWSQE